MLLIKKKKKKYQGNSEKLKLSSLLYFYFVNSLKFILETSLLLLTIAYFSFSTTSGLGVKLERNGQSNKIPKLLAGKVLHLVPDQQSSSFTSILNK